MAKLQLIDPKILRLMMRSCQVIDLVRKIRPNNGVSKVTSRNNNENRNILTINSVNFITFLLQENAENNDVCLL